MLTEGGPDERSLICSATGGEPKPSVTWYKDGEELRNGNGSIIIENGEYFQNKDNLISNS